MTYTIHTRSTDPGMGYCDTPWGEKLMHDMTPYPYVQFTERGMARAICIILNLPHNYAAGDLEVFEESAR